MVVLLTCKNEDPIQNESASLRVVTTLYIDGFDAQGQITPELAMRSCGNLNSFKLSCVPLLSARMNMIQSKMNALERSQLFSHCKSIGIFPDAQWQLTP